eukprot:7250054-Prymnesium_polylepis.1
MQTRSMARDEQFLEPPEVLVQVLCVRADGAILLYEHDESSGPALAGLSTGLLGVIERGEALEAAARRLAEPLILGEIMRVAQLSFYE